MIVACLFWQSDEHKLLPQQELKGCPLIQLPARINLIGDIEQEKKTICAMFISQRTKAVYDILQADENRLAARNMA